MTDTFRTRTLLAQPEPVGLSFSDVMEWSSGIEPWATWLAPGGCLENAHFELDQLVTSALARWCRPTPQPPADGEIDAFIHHWWEAYGKGYLPNSSDKALVTAALARWGHPTPEPPADGEVGELVEWLRGTARGLESQAYPQTAEIITRAADLLERLTSPCYVLDVDTGAIASFQS